MVGAEELRRLYWEEGKDLPALAALYGYSPGAVWGWFQKQGVPTRSAKEAAALRARAVTPDEQARMVALYASGLSSNDIAKQLGRDGRLVRLHLEMRGALRKRPNSNVWILSWYSREMTSRLSAIGLMGGNKSRILRLPEVPSGLLGHFLRGYWDADGSWRRKGGHLGTQLTCASEAMIDDLRCVIGGRKHVGYTTLNGKSFKRCSLSLRAKETRSFVDLIYGQSEDRLRCARKYSLVAGSAGERS